MSNMRQVGIGYYSYLVESEDQFMPISDSVSVAWYKRLVNDSRFYPWRGNGYLQGIGGMFCPSQQLTSVSPSFTEPQDAAYERGHISYGMTYGLQINFQKLGYPTELARLGDILKPSETILNVEAEVPNLSTGSFYLHWYYPGPASTGAPALRHSGNSNVLWVDGHVTRVQPTVAGDIGSMYTPGALSTQIFGVDNYWDRW